MTLKCVRELSDLKYTQSCIFHVPCPDINFIGPGVTVPGYVLLIGRESSVANWNRCGNYNSEQCFHCVVQLDNVSCAINF